MYSFLLSLLTWFIPPDDTNPKDVKHYRWRMAAVTVFCFCVSMFTVVVSSEGIPSLGVGKLVWADAIEAHVQQAVNPLSDRVKKLEDTSARVERKLNDTLAQGKAATIRAEKIKHCNALPFSLERDSIMKEIERLQDEYRDLKGMYYDIPRCAEL